MHGEPVKKTALTCGVKKAQEIHSKTWKGGTLPSTKPHCPVGSSLKSCRPPMEEGERGGWPVPPRDDTGEI